MPGHSYKLARIAGIRIGFSPWWLLIVAMITIGLGSGYYPSEVAGLAPLPGYALGLASALLLFGSVLAHEFGHALIARRHGIEVEEIDLWLLGGVTRMRGQPRAPMDELRYAAAGPAVTALVAAVFGAAALALPASAPAVLRAMIEYQAEVNAIILVFNLLPAFPLDGGRITRAILWRRREDLAAATRTATKIGRGFGWAIVGLGLLAAAVGYADGLWLAIVGGFLIIAAGAEQAHQAAVAAVTGTPVAELMSSPVVAIPAQETLADAALTCHRQRHTCYPVTAPDGTAVGLLPSARVRADAHHAGYATLVAEVVELDPDLIVAADTDAAELLERTAFAEIGHAVVIDADRLPIGIVALSDIERNLSGPHDEPPAGARKYTDAHL